MAPSGLGSTPAVTPPVVGGVPGGVSGATGIGLDVIGDMASSVRLMVSRPSGMPGVCTVVAPTSLAMMTGSWTCIALKRSVVRGHAMVASSSAMLFPLWSL